jgi:hypothetical protein
MDKTQTPPGRDGGDEDAGKKQIHLGPKHMMKAKDVAKSAEKELNKAMDNTHKNKARKMYELADRLSKVDTSKLNEQELSERDAMIQRLAQEAQAMKKSMAEGAERLSYDTLELIDEYIAKIDPSQDRDELIQDILNNHIHTSELEWALQDKDNVAEADEEDLHTSFNVVKLGGALNADPRSLRAAIQRHMQGSPTRTDVMVLANAFVGMLKNSDDRQIQMIANLIKAGNPTTVPQESTAAIAERNAFVDAMRQAKKGEKFTVGGREFTKTTSHGDDEPVKEAVNTEAYDRLKRVFDFSDYKG